MANTKRKVVVDNQTAALKLLRRPSGATVEQITDRLELESTKAARGLVDRLRFKGIKVKNIGSHTFKVRTRANPRTA